MEKNFQYKTNKTMAQKVKVASAQFKKEGEGKFGKWYLYEIKLEGDDKTYQYMSKTNPQTKLPVDRKSTRLNSSHT